MNKRQEQALKGIAASCKLDNLRFVRIAEGVARATNGKETLVWKEERTDGVYAFDLVVKDVWHEAGPTAAARLPDLYTGPDKEGSFVPVSFDPSAFIDAANFVCGPKDFRPFMEGVALDITQSLSQPFVVATNGIAAYFTGGASVDTGLRSGNIPIVIPTRAMMAAMKNSPVVSLAEERKDPKKPMEVLYHVRVQTPDYILYASCIEGQFPNYRRVIPDYVFQSKGDAVVALPPKEALRRLEAVASGRAVFPSNSGWRDPEDIVRVPDKGLYDAPFSVTLDPKIIAKALAVGATQLHFSPSIIVEGTVERAVIMDGTRGTVIAMPMQV